MQDYKERLEDGAHVAMLKAGVADDVAGLAVAAFEFAAQPRAFVFVGRSNIK